MGVQNQYNDRRKLRPELREKLPTLHNKTCIKTSTKKKQGVMVTGDSLLCWMEVFVCRLNPLFREVCCLPGAQIRDITTRLKSLL